MTKRFDLLAVGAINVDYILKQIAAPGSRGEIEDVVPAHEARRRLRNMPSGTIVSEPGGSAFNTARGVSSLNAGLHVGFIGVLGGQDRGTTFLRALDKHRMPRELVQVDRNNRPGACFASIDPETGHRNLLTSPFANEGMREWLPTIWKEWSERLCQARMLHVSSLFDDQYPSSRSSSRALVQFVRNMRARNPGLIISFDPGTYWIRKKRAIVDAILSHTDYLFLNASEMAALVHEEGQPVDVDLADSAFKKLSRDSTIIVMKQPDRVCCFQQIKGRPIQRDFLAARLSKSELRNPVGTGDALAAGFIAAKLLQLDMREAVCLGQDLARQKLLTSQTDLAERQYEKHLEKARVKVFAPVDRDWHGLLFRVTERFHSYAMALEVRNKGLASKRMGRREYGLSITSEYDVQRLLRAVLCSEWDSVESEVQTAAVGSRSGRADFGIKNAGEDKGILVECKYVRVPRDQKLIANSLDSIATRYSRHAGYDRLFVFIYDPNRRLSNPDSFLTFEGERSGFADIRVGISRPSRLSGGVRNS